MLIRAFTEGDTDEVVALWRSCGLVRPWNDPHRDIARKLRVQPELFLVGCAEGAAGGVVATAMGGYDGHRGWVYYVAVAPEAQGSGLGRALMQHLETLLVELGCPKINLQVRHGNEQALGFYRALGYDVDGAASVGKRLIPD